MARETLASLRAANEALRAENAELRAKLEAPSTKATSTFRKNAATLYVDGVPRCTYFTHSAAYAKMRVAKDMGHRAVYVPLN